jgi:hypothetical protein
MTSPLERFANRLAGDPLFLAAALNRFAASESVDDEALAAKLGCSVATLTPLRLCRMPRSESPFFWQDVDQIARRFGAKADELADVVRRGLALVHLQGVGQQASPASAGLLLAARDRPAEPPAAAKGEPP